MNRPYVTGGFGVGLDANDLRWLRSFGDLFDGPSDTLRMAATPGEGGAVAGRGCNQDGFYVGGPFLNA